MAVPARSEIPNRSNVLTAAKTFVTTGGKVGPRLRSHSDVKKYCEDNNIKYDAQQLNFHHQVGELIPQTHGDDDDSSGLKNYHTTIFEPTSYGEAMIQPEARSWQEAMEEELGVLKERNVYDIVQRSQNTKVIGCR
ncbi:hypothetical protein AVEN_99817-1 [Araneus ventricosus]|uniref:Retrovirus-related Pol polyprotein from transposon TNT 1-94 n=1 Tax=Araneus ventricosus TaxID=182803 RepID=A0A4Y2KE83_ARAVE|nr:hypothetical protein AVEN_99817-1 [Araneus ventricosus]